MTKHKPILTDAEMHVLICGNLLPVGLSLDRLESFARNVEQYVLKKLAEQKPVAWTSAEIMSDPSFVDDDDYAFMYKTKSHLLDDFCGYPEATPVPLYTHPTPSYQGILDNSNHIPDGSKLVSLSLSVDTKEAQALLQSYLDSLDGWQLVPKSATDEMQDAACLTNGTTGDRYKAMLAAAPKFGEEE